MAMSGEFKFIVMDANQNVEKQQSFVRKVVGERINLARFRRRRPLPLPPSIQSDNKAKETEEDLAA
jgi:hypothetical protein